MLTDGKRGSHDYDNNWVIFAGKDLEVVIDLEEVKKVRKDRIRILPAWILVATASDECGILYFDGW